MRTCKGPILAVLFCAMMLGSGCASIVSGGNQTVRVTSEPVGAKVTADGANSITTPGTFVLKTRASHTLVAELSGHPTQQQQVDRKLNNWVFGNILIGGIIGLIIDIATGSINELKPKEVHFNFTPPANPEASAVPLRYQQTLVDRRDELKLLGASRNVT